MSAELVNLGQSAARDGRDSAGRFTVGNGGRKPGSRNVVRRARLADVEALWPEALEQLRTKVRAGDMGALKLIAEYCLPKGPLLELESDDPGEILSAAMQGLITGDEAVRLSQTAKLVHDAKTIDLLRERLDALEAQLLTAQDRRR